MRNLLLPFAAAIAILPGAVLTRGQSAPPSLPDAKADLATADPYTLTPPGPSELPNDPVADPRDVVILGKARFTILTGQLIRMEWAANGKFEDHASLVFINRRLPPTHFKKNVSEDKSRLTIKTAALTLTYTPKPDQDGRFSADSLSISLDTGDKLTVWRPGLTDEQNLMGTTRTLDGANGDKTREPIEPGLISRSGWAVVDDTTRPLFDSTEFSFRQGENSPWPWVMERPASESPDSYSDWYFFGYGNQYKRALGDYVRVAGRIPLPPRFAFGAWWSRYWAYSDQEIEEIIRGFHENDVPLDVFVIDMDWHPTFGMHFSVMDASNHSKGWTGYTWNRLYFPDPDQFLARLHANSLKTSLNLHPASGIQPWEEQYPAMAKAMGVDPASQQFIPFDIADKKFTTNYFNLVLHPLERQGIDFWWLDWQQEKTTRVAGVNPTWWLNYVHFTDQEREGKRPLLFHRWGGLGNHRYQIGFSGDTVSVWPSLAFQPWFTATAANVGYAYWSHDIGGHMPGAVDPELFTRWVEFGAFSPILRTHTTKNPDSERRIWAYPEPFSSVLRDTFQLRYALQPYLYTEARRTYDTGVAFLRPLYYDWPSDNHSYENKGEYAFGDQMIVAPVVTPADKVTGLASQDVYLPEGDWIEWPTGRHFAGKATAHRSFLIEQIPVYLKAGAIVPMQPPELHTSQRPPDPLILNVWPLSPGASSAYSVYEDSGAGIEYQRGVFARTPIKASQSADTLRVEIGPVQGSFPGMLRTRSYELRLPDDWPPERVTVNGAAVNHAGATGHNGWTYDGNTLTTAIPVPATNVESRLTIEVLRAKGVVKRRAEIDGFPGVMTRLRAAYDAMNETYPVSNPPDPLIDAMQSGDRLGYHPERAFEELAHYRSVIPQAQDALDEIARDFPQQVDAVAKPFVNGIPPEAMEAQKQHRLDAMTRAQKLLADLGR